MILDLKAGQERIRLDVVDDNCRCECSWISADASLRLGSENLEYVVGRLLPLLNSPDDLNCHYPLEGKRVDLWILPALQCPRYQLGAAMLDDTLLLFCVGPDASGQMAPAARMQVPPRLRQVWAGQLSEFWRMESSRRQAGGPRA